MKHLTHEISPEAGTEKALGGNPRLWIFHICQYAASRFRVARGIEKRVAAPVMREARVKSRQQLGFTNEPQRQRLILLERLRDFSTPIRCCTLGNRAMS